LFRIDALDRKDEEQRKLEDAKNNLESYIFEQQEAVTTETVISISTEEERQKFSELLSETMDWLYTDGERATVGEYKKKLQDLKALGDVFQQRIDELNKPSPSPSVSAAPEKEDSGLNDEKDAEFEDEEPKVQQQQQQPSVSVTPDPNDSINFERKPSHISSPLFFLVGHCFLFYGLMISF
jgi:heat shock protein 4